MVHQISAPLPTPPTSPSLQEQQQVFESYGPNTNRPALQLLNQLVNFYQQERVWVSHTRAALFELTVAADSASDDRASSPSASMLPGPSTSLDGVPEVTIKSEPMDMDMSACESPTTRNTRWMRRKNSMRLQLKLEGVSPASRGRSRRRRGTPGAPAPQQQQQPQHEPQPGEHGARLLQQFGELMDARMQSCQRVSKLVEEVGRQDLLFSR